MLKLGILGSGRIGQVHAANAVLDPAVQLVAVADAIPAAAQALSDKTGAAARTVEEIIASDDIDAIIIGTPTTTHYDLIHAAAAAGKAIFCEKPVDMSATRIRECIAAVETANVPFFTAFQRRFDPSFAALRQRITDGQIGAVELINITSRDPSPPPISYIETSGGIFRDMMIHDLDVARFLLDEEPVRIYATGAALVDPAIGAAGDIDTAAVTMTTTSGKICMINCSRRATYGYDQRVDVLGQKGQLSVGNVPLDHVTFAGPPGYTSAAPLHFFLDRYAAAYARELSYFAKCIAEETAPRPTIRDGLQAQLLADAATLSWETGEAVTVSGA